MDLEVRFPGTFTEPRKHSLHIDSFGTRVITQLGADLFQYMEDVVCLRFGIIMRKITCICEDKLLCSVNTRILSSRDKRIMKS